MSRRLSVIASCLHDLRINVVFVLFLLGMQIHVPSAMALQETVDKSGAVILRLHTTLLSVMQNSGRLGYQGRYAKLEPVIRTNYDLPIVARLVTGNFWRKLNRSQRIQFVHVFSHLVIATYANRFDGYSGEKFNTISEQRLGHDEVLVHTLLSKHDGGVVHLDYILRQSNGKWRIINVIADGVSDLALKRADYVNVLNTKGFSALIIKLKQKIVQYQ